MADPDTLTHEQRVERLLTIIAHNVAQTTSNTAVAALAARFILYLALLVVAVALTLKVL